MKGCDVERKAFTLVELLVVLAVLSVLMALLLPAVSQGRSLARRVVCQSNLRQLGVAWEQYHVDFEGAMYQGVNCNTEFGGWRGRTTVRYRPLNAYLGVPTDANSVGDAKVFRCPADSGVENYPEPCYLALGNSYQTNSMLVGPDQLPTGYGPSWVRDIHRAINDKLRDLNVSRVSDPSRLLLVGDWNWVSQWDPLWTYTCGLAWHGKTHTYNLAFMDGHVDTLVIRKGLYLGPSYRVQPFREIDKTVNALQEEVPCVCGRP